MLTKNAKGQEHKSAVFWYGILCMIIKAFTLCATM